MISIDLVICQSHQVQIQALVAPERWPFLHHLPQSLVNISFFMSLFPKLKSHSGIFGPMSSAYSCILACRRYPDTEGMAGFRRWGNLPNTWKLLKAWIMSFTTSSWLPFLIWVRILTLSNLLHHPASSCEIMNRIREGPSRDDQIEPQTSTSHILTIIELFILIGHVR